MTRWHDRVAEAISALRDPELGGGAHSNAIALAEELISCGEWRLCLDLAEAASRECASDVDRVRCELIRADALLGKGDSAAAGVLVARVLSPERSGSLDTKLLAWARVLMSRALYHQHSIDEAFALAIETRSSLLELGESNALGWCALLLGSIAWSRGDLSQAKACYLEALTSGSRLKNAQLQAAASLNLGKLKRHRGQWREAEEEYGNAAVLWKKLGNRERVSHCLHGLAIMEWKRGRLSAARKLSEETLAIALGAGDGQMAAYSNQLCALIDLHEGRLDAAAERLIGTREYAAAGSASRARLLATEFLGDVELERANSGAARRLYEEALSQAVKRVPNGDIVGELRRRLAECSLLEGDLLKASSEIAQAQNHNRELGDRYEEACTYRVAAQCAAALGRVEEAADLFETGAILLEDLEARYELARLQMARGAWLESELAGSRRSLDEAREAYQTAASIFDRIGSHAKRQEASSRLSRVVLEREHSVRDATSSLAARQPRPRPRELERRSEWAFENFQIVTVNPGLLETLETVEKLARSRSAVLVLGESGTGKELVAQAIHRLSGRRGDFLAINCAALPREVIESELFGHVTGAFTGATKDKPGLLEACDHGTAFLDEIGEMSMDLQSRLLRFLESGEIRRVGSTRVSHVSTRVVAATNREASAMRTGQGFRPDLYYRLAHGVVQLPALRQRGAQDIELLARRFLSLACAEEKKRVTLSDAAIERLVGYGWPGNVRELKTAIVQRVVLAHDGHDITADELRLDDTSVPSTLDEELEQTERRRIQEALRQTANSKADAARLLGIPRTTLINRIKRLGLE